MNDKEMLIAAAQAAGIEVVTPTMLEYGKWNPLEDDGDALRLAVKLRLEILNDGYMVVVRTGMLSNKAWQTPLWEDECESTRRAIVRAAAEIGKAMQ